MTCPLKTSGDQWPTKKAGHSARKQRSSSGYFQFSSHTLFVHTDQFTPTYRNERIKGGRIPSFADLLRSFLISPGAVFSFADGISTPANTQMRLQSAPDIPDLAYLGVPGLA
jgi:hypothetical protein